MKTHHGLPALLIAVFWLSCGPANGQDDDGSSWWKGNLHTHSLWSDGNDFPEMITKWYADRDYHFLALSDHNVLSQGRRWMNLSKVEERGGKVAMEKYLAAFGENWVETRELPPPPENPMSADRVRWEHIQRVYELCDRNVSETARRLNMHRRTLQRILAKRSPR